jgi:serine/threonine protein kinase/Tol biopolymer transport system component
MTPERWRGIEEVYHAASECAPAERDSFLATACGTDSDLRREVESLLAQHGEPTDEIERQANGPHDSSLTNGEDHAVSAQPGIGSRFGPYRIEALLGKGGMGEVWKARDTRLNRDVAIKFSVQQFTDRFGREARAIAALNHSNICTIHDVGPDYLVMELVEGLSLDERIRRGPIPVAEALVIAKQIADALESAHEKGIVHRDLKPANIKIRPDGSVKLLDFGLATAVGEESAGAVAKAAPMTTQSMIIGTPGYMPPEQARGEKADKRADIWAFGVVLYEMVTGRRLFEGKTPSDTLAAVLTREPDWERAPAQLRLLLRRCLEKDPRKRLRDIGDAMPLVDVTNLAGSSGQAASLPHTGWIAAVALFALSTVVVSVVHFREKPAELKMTQLTIDPPEKVQFSITNPAAVSPDGTQVVFSAGSPGGWTQFWIRPLNSLTAQPLTGTVDAYLPFWSPDSKWIGFFADDKLKKISASGGPPIELADARVARGGTWNQDGVILFAPTLAGGFMRIQASGGAAVAVTHPDPLGKTQRFPSFLPDGRHFVYQKGGTAVRLSSLDSPGQDLLLDDSVDSYCRYSQGYLLYLRGKTLMARPFDSKGLAFAGEAVPVAGQIQTRGLSGTGHFSASTNGVLIYERGSAGERILTWLDRAGQRTGELGEPDDLRGTAFSPDRNTLAVMIGEASSRNVDIWLYEVLRSVRTRFTFDPAVDNAPVWSPDGQTIIFSSNRSGTFDLFRRPADGSRKDELLYHDALVKGPGDFSPDGKNFVYEAKGNGKTGDDIWILPDPLGTPSTPHPLIATEANEGTPRVSPDGHWIAFVSDESKKDEVYVSPFPDHGSRIQVSAGGGGTPRWRADGKELFYLTPGLTVMSAEVETKGGTFNVKKVARLFDLPKDAGGYDVSRDGQRFIAALPKRDEVAQPLTVMLNWTAALKK